MCCRCSRRFHQFHRVTAAQHVIQRSASGICRPILVDHNWDTSQVAAPAKKDRRSCIAGGFRLKRSFPQVTAKGRCRSRQLSESLGYSLGERLSSARIFQTARLNHQNASRAGVRVRALPPNGSGLRSRFVAQFARSSRSISHEIRADNRSARKVLTKLTMFVS